ncbi:MAG: lytic murein transglycosylase, partial [Paracoccaceae bacterium]|nr:lytic murein transglycosylase [Paracoccaceae bacterium]
MQPDADLTFETWVQAFGAKAQLAGLDLGLYAQMMSGVKVQTLVLKKDRTQPEFSSRIWSYLDRA